ncbi:hypothetical protein [Pontixanthobacter aquaemixtae]|uniref:Uncharacterized protein n=1 Tax=Pontixanthobacter aquaemixtae TaxID=1958940 RepID=A0A844ZSZ0_9SPHN|nr:hypothetical protein [Pontixanthobacter aquaemixtae]MXO90848.1 hypothetical protein [Pontixanthobacter aquaemixtae]
MLALYDKTQAIPGVIVYRDHQDPGQFYFISERPRIARNNGVPALSFVKFRRDITDNVDFEEGDSLGGGILNFTVDLAVTEREQDQIKREIKRAFENVPENIKLAPVSVRDGSVRLSVMRDAADDPEASPDAPRGLRLFEEVHGSTKPSLIGDQRATFTVMLNREMATAMEQTLRGGVSMFGVNYQLFFLGMTPAMSVKVEADYKRVYTSLETELGVQGQIQAVSIAADIEAAYQKLREDGVIKVEITEFTDDADLKAKGHAAWDWFKGQLTADFFQSTMPVPAIMQPDSGGGILGRLQDMFGAIPRAPATGSLSPGRGAAATTPPNTAPAATGPSDQVTPTTETNRREAAARGGGGGSGAGNLASELSPFRVGFSLKIMHQDELRTRRFDYNLQSAIQAEANPNGMFSGLVDGFNMDDLIFEVDMDDPFFDRLRTTVTMGQDLAAIGVSSVAVNMEYPGEREAGENAEHIDGFEFRPGDSENKLFTTFLDDDGTREYRYRMTITFDPTTEWRGKDSQVVTPWLVSAETQLTLAPIDAVERLDVEIALSNQHSESVTQVEVEVRYENPATGFKDNRTFVLEPGGESHNWRLRLADNAPRGYEYRVRYFFAQGNTMIETPWEERDQPSIIVNVPFRSKHRVMVNPLLLDSANLLQAIVDIEYREPDTGYTVAMRQEFMGGDVLVPQSFEIPTLAEDPPPIVYSTTILKLDGQVITERDQETESGIILLSEGTGVVQRVEVRLPQDSLGSFQALKVDLTGRGDVPDTTSVIFTPSQTQKQLAALVQPSGRFKTYDFKVTGYDQLGVASELAAGSSTDRVMIVPMQ